MKGHNLGDLIQVKDVLPVASVTSTGNGTGVDLVDIAGEIAVILDCSAATAGTNPTMDIKLQESDASGSGYTDISSGAFTQVTNAASVQKISLNKDSLKRYLRAVKTIGGTDSPAFLVSVKAVGVNKYPA